MKLNPDGYYDSGKRWFSMLYALYDAAFVDYFGEEIPARQTDFPSI